MPPRVTGSVRAQLQQRITAAHRDHSMLRSGDATLVFPLRRLSVLVSSLAVDDPQDHARRCDSIMLPIVAVHLPTGATVEIVEESTPHALC